MKYVELLEWTAESDGIRIAMLGEDQEVHRFEVSPGCAGALLAALAAESEKLYVPENEQQFIRPTGMQVGKTAADEPVILLSLKGGTELPLVFKPDALGKLITALEDLRQVLERGSQIRWH